MNDIHFVCVFDHGSRELGLNHLISLQRNGISNYSAYVTDCDTFNYIQSHGYNVVFEDCNDENITDEAKDFGTRDFNMFSYIRYKIVNKLLKTHQWVWYMDVDTVVMSGIKDFSIDMCKDKDIIFQNDCHMLCTGCVLYNSNELTLGFTDNVWKHATPSMNDQNLICQLHKAGSLTSLNIDIFNYMEFPNGLLYFDTNDLISVPPEILRIKQRYRANEHKKTAFVHANWMIGVDTKIKAIKNKGLWYVSY